MLTIKSMKPAVRHVGSKGGQSERSEIAARACVGRGSRPACPRRDSDPSHAAHTQRTNVIGQRRADDQSRRVADHRGCATNVGHEGLRGGQRTRSRFFRLSWQGRSGRETSMPPVEHHRAAWSRGAYCKQPSQRLPTSTSPPATPGRSAAAQDLCCTAASLRSSRAQSAAWWSHCPARRSRKRCPACAAGAQGEAGAARHAGSAGGREAQST